MNVHETDAPDTLLNLRDAAAALDLRPATVTQDILRGQLAAVRLPRGAATRLFVAPAELERYRREPLGAQGWDKRRGLAPPAPPAALTAPAPGPARRGRPASATVLCAPTSRGAHGASWRACML